jgi:hypothetical protein
METLQKLQNDIKVIFSKIEAAKSIEELKLIINLNQYPYLKKFDEKKYPRLDISLTTKDIDYLKEKNLIDKDGFLCKSIAESDSLSSLEKLLYSILWKNGDLGKESHIINGVIGGPDKKSGFVFYYFGRHLENKTNPIIDQNVIRAFSSFQASKNKFQNIEKILNKKDVTAKDKKECEEYIAWQNQHKLKKAEPLEFTYYVDRLLFALGKYLKNQYNNRQKL